MEIAEVLRILPKGLTVELNGPESPDEAWLQENWRSVACRTCGVCCHSSLIPITSRDFSSFYKRLDTQLSEREFAEQFLKNPDTLAPTFTIETLRHGGKCLFLEKKASFRCSIWDQRPHICADFFCHPMVAFEQWEQGDNQDYFDLDAPWLSNFVRLVDRVIIESVDALFDDDREQYFNNKRLRDSEAIYLKERGRF